MAKKCIVCGENANFCIKDSSECYCEDCAVEHFADMSYLERIEDQSQKIKELMDKYDRSEEA